MHPETESLLKLTLREERTWLVSNLRPGTTAVQLASFLHHLIMNGIAPERLQFDHSGWCRSYRPPVKPISSSPIVFCRILAPFTDVPDASSTSASSGKSACTRPSIDPHSNAPRNANVTVASEIHVHQLKRSLLLAGGRSGENCLKCYLGVDGWIKLTHWRPQLYQLTKNAAMDIPLTPSFGDRSGRLILGNLMHNGRMEQWWKASGVGMQVRVNICARTIVICVGYKVDDNQRRGSQPQGHRGNLRRGRDNREQENYVLSHEHWATILLFKVHIDDLASLGEVVELPPLPQPPPPSGPRHSGPMPLIPPHISNSGPPGRSQPQGPAPLIPPPSGPQSMGPAPLVPPRSSPPPLGPTPYVPQRSSPQPMGPASFVPHQTPYPGSKPPQGVNPDMIPGGRGEFRAEAMLNPGRPGNMNTLPPAGMGGPNRRDTGVILVGGRGSDMPAAQAANQYASVGTAYGRAGGACSYGNHQASRTGPMPGREQAQQHRLQIVWRLRNPPMVFHAHRHPLGNLRGRGRYRNNQDGNQMLGPLDAAVWPLHADTWPLCAGNLGTNTSHGIWVRDVKLPTHDDLLQDFNPLAHCYSLMIEIGESPDVFNAIDMLVRASVIVDKRHWTKIPVPVTRVNAANLRATAAELNNLPFRVRYALETLTSNGTLPPELVTPNFIASLARIPPQQAEELLYNAGAAGNRHIPSSDWKSALLLVMEMLSSDLGPGIFGPSSDASIGAGASASPQSKDLVIGKPVKRKLEVGKSQVAQEETSKDEMVVMPKQICITFRVLVTPTRIVALPPERDLSNRLLREFSRHRDRFLRILLADEDGSSLYMGGIYEPWFSRVMFRLKSLLVGGIHVAGCHYQFLAFSGAQLRQGGAWFFSPTRPQSTPSNASSSRFLTEGPTVPVLGASPEHRIVDETSSDGGEESTTPDPFSSPFITQGTAVRGRASPPATLPLNVVSGGGEGSTTPDPFSSPFLTEGPMARATSSSLAPQTLTAVSKGVASSTVSDPFSSPYLTQGPVVQALVSSPRPQATAIEGAKESAASDPFSKLFITQGTMAGAPMPSPRPHTFPVSEGGEGSPPADPFSSPYLTQGPTVRALSSSPKSQTLTTVSNRGEGCSAPNPYSSQFFIQGPTDGAPITSPRAQTLISRSEGGRSGIGVAASAVMPSKEITVARGVAQEEEEEEVTAFDLRFYIGDLSRIKNIAKYAARLGQCFSCSYNAIEINNEEVIEMIEDIIIPDLSQENKARYTFSDGVGRISIDYLERILEGLGWPKGRIAPALQVRLGGCKGMLVPWGTDIMPPGKVQTRRSMKKFDTPHCALEIVQLANYMTGFMNRQIIVLLVALGVAKEPLIEHTRQMLIKLDRMIVDAAIAMQQVVQLGYLEGFLANSIRSALKAGVPVTEPFIKGMLQVLRSHALENVRSKARVHVPKAAFLYGGMDETGELEYGQVFVQIERPHEAPFVLPTGTQVAVTKNPCLHPGDIRVLVAQDLPRLRHLANLVIFPQKGPRPHTDEISGSDLDGDVYWVCWDKNLVPLKMMKPMDYEAHVGKEVKHQIEVPHVIEYFLEFLSMDALGRIDNAHLALSDYLPEGARSQVCLNLALRHNMAVDYNKTGVPAVMLQEDVPKEYPHFMEKTDKRSYRSKTALGKIFDLAVKKIKMPGESSKRTPVTPDPAYVLDHCPGFKEEVEAAQKLYVKYCTEIVRLMNKYGVFNECELISGWIIKPFSSSRKSADLRQQLLVEVALIRHACMEDFEKGPATMAESGKADNTAAASACSSASGQYAFGAARAAGVAAGGRCNGSVDKSASQYGSGTARAADPAAGGPSDGSAVAFAPEVLTAAFACLDPLVAEREKKAKEAAKSSGAASLQAVVAAPTVSPETLPSAPRGLSPEDLVAMEVLSGGVLWRSEAGVWATSECERQNGQRNGAVEPLEQPTGDLTAPVCEIPEMYECEIVGHEGTGSEADSSCGDPVESSDSESSEILDLGLSGAEDLQGTCAEGEGSATDVDRADHLDENDAQGSIDDIQNLRGKDLLLSNKADSRTSSCTATGERGSTLEKTGKGLAWNIKRMEGSSEAACCSANSESTAISPQHDSLGSKALVNETGTTKTSPTSGLLSPEDFLQPLELKPVKTEPPADPFSELLTQLVKDWKPSAPQGTAASVSAQSAMATDSGQKLPEHSSSVEHSALVVHGTVDHSGEPSGSEGRESGGKVGVDVPGNSPISSARMAKLVRASAWYYVAYNCSPSSKFGKRKAGKHGKVFLDRMAENRILSFAWIATEQLLAAKAFKSGSSQPSASVPVTSKKQSSTK